MLQSCVTVAVGEGITRRRRKKEKKGKKGVWKKRPEKSSAFYLLTLFARKLQGKPPPIVFAGRTATNVKLMHICLDDPGH